MELLSWKTFPDRGESPFPTLNVGAVLPESLQNAASRNPFQSDGSLILYQHALGQKAKSANRAIAVGFSLHVKKKTRGGSTILAF